MLKQKDEQKTIRVAVYVRVSTEEQAQYGFSIEAQKEKAVAFCKSQGWEIFKVYIDDGFKGWNLKRPKIKELLIDAEEKKFNVILMYKLDRLSRKLSDLTKLVEKFEELGIGIRSITEPFDTTNPTGKLLFNMLGSFAQFERELIGERTRLGIGRRVKEGKWTTTPPFGYNMVNGELIINEKEIAYYKRMVELFLYHNYGTGLIAIKLNEEDKVTRRAGKWSDSTIWNMLTNPVYCGLVRWRDNIFEGRHKAVITKDEFDTIQKRLREKNQVPERTHSSPNFLNGVIVCGLCNSTLTTAKGKKLYHYYACTGRQKGCNLSYVRTDKLHDAVLHQIDEVGKSPNIIQDHIDEHNRSHSAVISRLEKELLFAKREIVELIKKKDKKAAWLSENLPDKTVTSILGQEIEEISRQIEEIRNKVNQLELEIEQENLGKVNVEILGDFMLHFKDMFNTMDAYQKRLLIQSVVKKITVYSKDKIQLSLALPTDPANPKNPVAPVDISELKQGNSYPFYSRWGG